MSITTTITIHSHGNQVTTTVSVENGGNVRDSNLGAIILAMLGAITEHQNNQTV